VVQDYDLRIVGVLPAVASADELVRVLTGAFIAAGCDVHIGTRPGDPSAIRTEIRRCPDDGGGRAWNVASVTVPDPIGAP
jgi:hypothetical protein